jgi:hypothetical protein
MADDDTLSATFSPASSIWMMGVPPSLFSSEFWGLNRHTTLMLFPDIVQREGTKKKKKKIENDFALANPS